MNKADAAVVEAIRREGTIGPAVLRAKLSELGHGYSETGFRIYMMRLIRMGRVRFEGGVYYVPTAEGGSHGT